MQIVWLIIFCGGVGAGIFFVQARLVEYLDSGLSTYIEYSQKSELVLPNITLCLKNAYDDGTSMTFFLRVHDRLVELFNAKKTSFEFKLYLVDYLWNRLEFHQKVVAAHREHVIKHWHFTNYFS